MRLYFNRPGPPMGNTFIESFRLRDEQLNTELFLSFTSEYYFTKAPGPQAPNNGQPTATSRTDSESVLYSVTTVRYSGCVRRRADCYRREKWRLLPED